MKRPTDITTAGTKTKIKHAKLMETELAALAKERLLLSQGRFDVYLAKAKDIPVILNEIGRLRELTFREVGEGTGKDLDLDDFDQYYWQLFIWDREVKALIGGYRIGQGDLMMKEFGISGFYIHSLFEINPNFGKVLAQSVELGRSFVIKSYQKKRLPLFLLWKGILYFLLARPQYQFLLGPVSISRFYSEVSKSLIVAFVKAHFFNADLAQHITPRIPFNPNIQPILQEKLASLETLEALDNFIENIEPEHFRLPVLLKQYIRQNAKFIGFNLDPNFNDALDGLMILDLEQVREETIENLKKTW